MRLSGRILVTVCVAASVSILASLAVVLKLYAMPIVSGSIYPDDLQFGIANLALVFVAAALFAVLSFTQNLKRTLIFAGFFAVCWVTCSVILKTLAEVSLFPFVTIAALLGSVFAVHAYKLWNYDRRLTNRLLGVTKKGNLLRNAAELRVETSLALLESIFSVDEIIVFSLNNNGDLSPIGRTRKDPLAGRERNSSWQDIVRQCEEALSWKQTVENDLDPEKGTSIVTLPLDTGSETIGVLYISIRSGYEAEDRVLLESFAGQLARNFQRKLLKGETFDDEKWWNPLSVSYAQRRLLVPELIEGVLHEKSFASLATTELSKAHAVAFLDGTLTYSNQSILSLAGIRECDSRDLNLFSLLDHFKTPVFSDPQLAVRRVLQTMKPYACELQSEKTSETLELNIVPIFMRHEKRENEDKERRPVCLLVTVDNISEKVENKKLRSDMANLMSHELRTPITSINGFAEMLLLDENLPDEAREYLSIISSEAKRASSVLSNFLSVANLEQSDKQDFVKSTVDVESVVREVVDEYSTKARKKRIRIVEKPGRQMPSVSGDRGLLTQAFGHLVDNAIRYSPERSSVIVSTVLETDHLRVDVEDRGYGIPNAECEKIWQKFYRVSRDGQSKEEETTGLGLSLVKEIAEQHQGSVAVESTPGRGSKFSLRIPRL